jgi:hypothetical protein
MIPGTENPEGYDLIFEGSEQECLQELNTLTTSFENDGVMMVDEEKIGQRSSISKFATEKEGHVFDLVMADRVAVSVKAV